MGPRKPPLSAGGSGEGSCVYCRANDLRCKDVINTRDGCRIGFVGDFEIDMSTATIVALVVFGRWRCFGLLGRGKDVIIRWCDIKVIGEDAILIDCDLPRRPPRRKRRR